MSKIAIIDIGTNTFHLMIVDLEDDNKVLHKEKVAVRLGKNGISNNKIMPDAQERALKTLHHFKKIADSFQVTTIKATATSAVRNADNGKAFVKFIKEQSGIAIQVISGIQEAHYIYRGVKQALPISSETSLIMDIGGGSVEFIICNNEEILWLHSFEIGAQRLLDKFHKHDPIEKEDIKSLHNFLELELKPLIEQTKKYKPTKFIGASGTFDTLIDITYASQGLKKENAATYKLTRDAFNKIYLQLIKMNKAERLAIEGMSEMRVDMIVVASCLLDFIITKNNFSTIHVSTYALKEGVLSEILEKV